MHEVTETISISKKREVLEPTKYYTEIGERIIKYKSKSYYCFKHYDKKNRLIAEVMKRNLDLKNKRVVKRVLNVKFKELFEEMNTFSKKKIKKK